MADRNETRGRSRDRDDEDRPRGRDRGEDSGRGRGRDRDSDDDRGSRGGRSSGRSSGYQYQARDDSDVRRRADQGANDFDKILKPHIKMWKANDGDNRIRIIPPTWDKAKHFGLDIYIHYGVGPDRASYLCLQKMQGEADPIAEEHAEAVKDGDEEYAKEIAAKHRVLIYLIDRDNEKDGVQAWAMPSGLDRDIVKVSVDKASGEVLQIDHPEDGYDLTFEKNGTGIKTKYEGVAIARRSSPLGKDQWLEFAMENPLPDQLHFYDYDHIAKVFNGKGAHKEKDRDDDRGSRGGRDRDERPSSRDRDRDDDRGSRNEPQGRRREIDPDDVPDRGRDAGRDRGRDRSTTDTPTWDSVHGMTGQELEDLIDQEGLKINPNDAKSDDELADWICEDLKIEKTETRRRASTRDDPPDDDRPSDRLRRMRQSRD